MDTRFPLLSSYQC